MQPRTRVSAPDSMMGVAYLWMAVSTCGPVSEPDSTRVTKSGHGWVMTLIFFCEGCGGFDGWFHADEGDGVVCA